MVNILSPEQILENYNKMLGFIKDNFENDRADKLIKLYTDFEEQIALAPASASAYHHNAFPGGYVEHVMRVVQFAYGYYSFIIDTLKTDIAYNFTINELLFAALNHDLGKIGSLGEPLYLQNESQWHVKNQGKLYKKNEKVTHMTVSDRSIWLLNQYHIDITDNEYIAIKTHDGLYDDANKGYLMTYDNLPNKKNDMSIVLHHADHIACLAEKRLYNDKILKQI